MPLRKVIPMIFNFRDYFDFSEKLLRDAENTTINGQQFVLLSSSLIFAWIAIESFVNNLIGDFNQIPPDMLDMHEKAFLLEKKLCFGDRDSDLGKFIIDQNRNEFRRLDEKIFFLIAKFSTTGNLKGDSLWQNFERFRDKRNKIVHPRRDNDFTLDIDEVVTYRDVTKKIITLISENVLKKKIPF